MIDPENCEESTKNQEDATLFAPETWAQLPSFFAHLPEPVHIIVWGESAASQEEEAAARLCGMLADRFDTLTFQMLPQRVNFPYYPVIGFMGGRQDDWQDFGARIIGLPAGLQMTSLVTAVQAVSFRGMTLEAKTRIHLNKLQQEVRIELMTTAANEGGAIMAQTLFNMAVANANIRTHLIMADQFPAAITRYSVNNVPHTVINSRVHIEGVVDEETVLKHIAKAL